MADERRHAARCRIVDGPRRRCGSMKFNRRKFVVAEMASLALAVSLAIAGCAAAPQERVVADRDAISRELPMMAKYENKRRDLRKAIGFLAANGLFDRASSQEVKDSMDVEYVYYEASIISLAHGNMDDYRNFVRLAEKELERAKMALTARVQALREGPAS